MSITRVTPERLQHFRAHREPHYLYRCYDATERLVYIGLTVDPARRISVHRSHASRASVLLQCFMARWEADSDSYAGLIRGREAEVEAIRTEQPIFNQQETGTPFWLHASHHLDYIREHESHGIGRSAIRLAEYVAYLEGITDWREDSQMPVRERKAAAMFALSRATA